MKNLRQIYVRAMDLEDLGVSIAYINDERLKAETASNARLIAAAPELLEALQKIVELDNDAHPGLASWCVARSKAHDAAVSAIAKATGEQL